MVLVEILIFNPQDVSVTGRGYGVSHFLQFQVKNQMFPRPYSGSLKRGVGGVILKGECLLYLEELTEVFICESINHVLTTKHCQNLIKINFKKNTPGESRMGKRLQEEVTDSVLNGDIVFQNRIFWTIRGHLYFIYYPITYYKWIKVYRF